MCSLLKVPSWAKTTRNQKASISARLPSLGGPGMTARQRSLLEQHPGLADATEEVLEPKESEEKETRWAAAGGGAGVDDSDEMP